MTFVCKRCGEPRNSDQFRTREGHGRASVCNPCDAKRRAEQRPPTVRVQHAETIDNDLFRAAMQAFNRAFGG